MHNYRIKLYQLNIRYIARFQLNYSILHVIFSVVCLFKFVFSVTSVFGFTTAILNKRTPPGLLDRGPQGHLEASSQKSQSCVDFTFHGYDLDQLNETSHDKIISPLLVWTTLSSPSFHRQIQAVWCHVPSTTWHDFVLPNIKYDYHKRHFIARSLFIMSKFYVIVLCVRVQYVLYELFFHR